MFPRLDEAETRQLIDAQLRAAGWEADTVALSYRAGARPALGRNLAIAEWPTPAGPADYVLFLGLTPVAVVEAKRASVDVASALEQSSRCRTRAGPRPYRRWRPMSEARRFRDRYGPWALIAGASEGLGEAFARAVAARGLAVVLVARRADALARVASGIAADHGVATRVVVADLADAGCAAQIAAVTADLEVGLLVHNAALSVPGPFLDVPAEVHARAIAVNCASQVGLVHAFAGKMRGRGRGGIVIVSSLSGFYGSGDLAIYAATKAFGATLAEGLWFEFAPAGVDVVATCAGATLTPGYERRAPKNLPRLAPAPMAPADVAEDALRALGRGPRTIPGRGNRVASFILRALVPRRRAVGMMSAAARAVFDAERRADEDPK